MATSLLPQNMRDVNEWGPKLNDFLRVSFNEYTGALKSYPPLTGVLVGDGTVGAPSISFTSDDTTGFYTWIDVDEQVVGLAQAGAKVLELYNNSRLWLKDSLSAYLGGIGFGGTALTEGRTLTFDLNDGNRIIGLTGNPILDDWFNQNVKTTASPTFADLTISSPSNIYNLSHDSFANFVANEHIDWTSTAENFLTTGSLGAGVITGTSFITSQNIGVSGDADLLQLSANLLIVAGVFAATGNITSSSTVKGTNLITGSQIGITTDTDLLQLAADILTVNGAIVSGNIDVTGILTATSHIKADGNLYLKDPGAAYYLKVATLFQTITADRNLNIDVGDGNRTLTLEGNLDVEANSIINSDLSTDANWATSGSITGGSLITGGNIGIAADTDLIQMAANALTVNGTITGTSSIIGQIGDFGYLKTTNWLQTLEMTPPATTPPTNTIWAYAEAIHGFSFFSFKDDTGMVRKLARDSVIVVKNVRGTLIAAGRIVYATGSVDDVPTIDAAKADAAATMPAIGVTLESIADGAFGRVMQVGLLENVNTSAFSIGDVLYVSDVTAGVPKNTVPVTPSLKQEIGTVLVDSATVGAIQIVSRSVHQNETGTAQNTYVIGDGAAGSKTLTFNAATDGSIIWDETKFDFGANPILTTGTLGAGTIDATEIFNSAANLKIMPDVQGEVDFFGDTDVGDAAHGKAVYIHRKAAEGDSYAKLFITSGKEFYIFGVGATKLVFGAVGAIIDINPWAGADITMFLNAASGETDELLISGYRAGDAKRTLAIGVGVDAADTVSFDGLTNYWFDGEVDAQTKFKVAGTQVLTTQQAHIADAPGDTAANNAITVNAILSALETHGLLAAA